MGAGSQDHDLKGTLHACARALKYAFTKALFSVLLRGFKRKKERPQTPKLEQSRTKKPCPDKRSHTLVATGAPNPRQKYPVVFGADACNPTPPAASLWTRSR